MPTSIRILKKTNRFTLKQDDKVLLIFGPFVGSPLVIDFDDVDQKKVMKDANKLLRILNKHYV